jgi:hypothetical protein
MAVQILIDCYKSLSFEGITIEQWNKLLNPYVEWCVIMNREEKDADVPMFGHVYIPDEVQDHDDFVNSFNLLLAGMVGEIQYKCNEGLIVHSNFIVNLKKETWGGYTVQVYWKASKC